MLPAATPPTAADLALLRPVLALVGWTLLVLITIPLARWRAMRRHSLGWADFRHGESPRVPDEARAPNRAFMNLLEAPLLFYVTCFCALLAGRVDAWALGLAWAYVALRVLHSLVHLSYNRVSHRLVVFTLSNLVLGAMLARLLWPLI